MSLEEAIIKIIEEVFDPIIEHNPSFYLIDAEGLKNRIIEKIKKLEGNEMINKDELIEEPKINYEDLTKEEVIKLLVLAETANDTLHAIIESLKQDISDYKKVNGEIHQESIKKTLIISKLERENYELNKKLEEK